MLRSHDGCRIQLHRWGDSGPACILLHGFGEGSYVWDELAPDIVPRGQSITVDLRGHGESDWDPSRRYHLDSSVRDIECLIDELGLTHVAIVGHSLGGKIAARVAAARPARVFAVVLADSGPALRPQAIAQIHADFRSSHRIYRSIDDYLDWLRQRRILVASEMLRACAAGSLRRRADGGFELKADPGLADQSGETEDDAELWKAIAAVTCPALVLRGAASSVLTPDAALRTALAFPNAQLRTIECAGHGMMIENPKAFAEAVRSFVTDAAMRWEATARWQPDLRSATGRA